MSMTLGGALDQLRDLYYGHTNLDDDGRIISIDDVEAIEVILEVLSPSREQIERATWIDTTDNGCPMYECSACGAKDTKEPYEYDNPRLFCYRCGRPMTEEAVDILLKRWEAKMKQKPIDRKKCIVMDRDQMSGDHCADCAVYQLAVLIGGVE